MNRKQFRTRIRKSLANETLQIALDANAERRVNGRVNAFASLPDWRERRQRAHALRADVIERLDEYLEQFIHNATQNGFTVHRAKNAAEAIQIILQITQHAVRNTETGIQVDRYTSTQVDRYTSTQVDRYTSTQVDRYTSKQVDRYIGTQPTEHTILKRSEADATLRSIPQGRNTQHAPRNVLVAKSKSMVSEEINLNHALEAEGMKVVETDLGEYIVQLRNERPSHIITPAVHLRRHEVGQLFHEKLGVPYTEDIPTLTNIARKVLREVFLTADAGISGVNFGVAETGGICIVTNEGNGRMVTTLPPVHIALMGMERLVRNFDDLAIMLSLLPRSATGQKLSVYTQIIHKPLDGQQRHIVLLDNGRSRLRNSPLKESLYCIRCGACLNACPVFREIGGHAYDSVYPGPIGSVISAGLFGSEFVPLAQASSLCGACKEACPVDIDLPKLLTRVRAGLAPDTQHATSLSPLSTSFLKIYARLATHPRLFALSQKFAALGTFLLSPFGDHVRLPAFTGWGYSKDLPRFAWKTFEERYTGKQVDRYISRQEDSSVMATTAPLPQSDVNKVERFIEELTKVNGRVVRTAADEVTNEVIEFLRSRNINRIHLEPNVLDEESLAKAGITVSREVNAALRVGATRSLCGLADTGSVLEADGEGGKLYASLLPEIHLTVLRESDIYPSLENALRLTRDTKSAVFITGPSRTGDIEMSHTIGVHGPGEVVVFLTA